MARKFGRTGSTGGKNWNRYLKQRNLSEALRGTYPVVQKGMSIDLIAGLSNALNANLASAAPEIIALSNAITQRKIPPSRVRQAHNEIGAAAQRSVLAAYDNRRNRRDLPAYRKTARNPRNIRYAGGKLRAALRAPDFYEATPRGLNFINVQRLSKEAKHWRRLNFGAGVPNSSRQFNIYFADMLVGAIGLDPASTGGQPGKVWLPPGRFVEPGGGGKRGAAQRPGAPGTGIFFPLGELRGGTVFKKQQNGAYGPSKGPRKLPSLTIVHPRWVQIQATNFLDAGLRRLAAEWGPAYTRLYQEHFDETMKNARVRQLYQPGSSRRFLSYAKSLPPPKMMSSRARVKVRKH